jgi:hypothetical protein
LTGRVIAFPNRSPQNEQPDDASFACALCGVDYHLEAGYECVRCGVSMHGACYWARIASLEEWRVYLEHVLETKDNLKPNVVCAACRQREGLGN